LAGVELDRRRIAIVVARGRVVIGLAALVAPGLTVKALMGDADPATRTLARMLGVRDLALGLGAITSVRERTQDAEWVSMGALADGVDALAGLFTRGLPARARLMGVAAAGAAVVGLQLARDLAAERDADER
jgi:hypothetical protein